MATYTAQTSGSAVDPTIWNPNGVPSASDSEIIAGVTVTYPNMTTLDGNSIVLGSTGTSTLAFNNADGTDASYLSVLNAGTHLDASIPSSNSTVLFAGALQNDGQITAGAVGGSLTIDGRALVAASTDGALLINNGSMTVSAGDTLNVNLSGTTDINGNMVAASTGAAAAALQNSGTMMADGGTLNVLANVTTPTVAGSTPNFTVKNNGHIEFGGAVAAGQTVNFTAPASNTGTTNSDYVKLDNVAGFAGGIQGYGNVGDIIDLGNVSASGVTFANNTLGVQTTSGGNTTTAGNLALGLSNAIGVQMTSDNAGGTNMSVISAFTGNAVTLGGAYRNSATITPASGTSATQAETVTLNGVTTSYLNANQINFADGIQYYSAASTGGQADLLYSALLQRAPDAAGLGYYATQLQNGLSTTQVAQGFISSSEYQSTYGNQSSGDYVQNLYTKLLGRTADSSGLSYWQGQIDSNTLSRAQVAASFVTTPEVQSVQDAPGSSSNLSAGVFGADPAAVQVQSDYQTIFGRSADSSGLGYWTQQLHAGLTQQDVLSNFIASREFSANAAVQTNAGFVQQIQTNALGTNDASGQAFWTGKLDSGAITRAGVAAAYANSGTLAANEASTITNHGIVLAS